jgi:hypothetical protein
MIKHQRSGRKLLQEKFQAKVMLNIKITDAVKGNCSVVCEPDNNSKSVTLLINYNAVSINHPHSYNLAGCESISKCETGPLSENC